jgi:hypothetical protein
MPPPPPYFVQGHACETRQEHEAPLARVVLLRARGEILGTVEASDRDEAKAVAAVQFELDEIQRNRIMVQELA